jgi:Protein of unknown function (DUF1571)
MVKDKMQPEEVVLFKFRKEPWSVYFKWLGKEGHGREVLFVKGQHEGKIHTKLAACDSFILAGKRLALPPDNPMVRSASRYPITAAGIGASIDRIQALLQAEKRGDRSRGTLTVRQAVVRPEFSQPVAGLEQVIPVGAEELLPRGGHRLYCFDPISQLPVLISTRDERGREVEYYRYDRLQFPVGLDADDFNPDKIWAKPNSKVAASKR